MAENERQCTATSKRTGERCRRIVPQGAVVCAWHGGKAPAVKAKAERRAELIRAEAEARQQVAARGTPMTLREVYEELLNTAAMAVAWRDEMQSLVDHLRELRYTSVIGTEQIRGEVQLLERGMTRVAKVLELIARLDLDTRKANLDQAQASVVVGALRRILDDLFAALVDAGLDRERFAPVWEQAIGVVVPRELRRAAGGGQ